MPARQSRALSQRLGSRVINQLRLGSHISSPRRDSLGHLLTGDSQSLLLLQIGEHSQHPPMVLRRLL